MIYKVNIDELIDLLLKFRQTHEYVDIKMEEEANTLRVRAHDKTKKNEPPKGDDNINDLNQLIG